MDALRRTMRQFREQFNNMAPGARLQLVCVPLLVLAGLGWVAHDRSGPAEEALLMGKAFSADELKNAEAALRQGGFSQFRVKGQTILAPRSEAAAYNAALITSDKGLPDNFGKEFDRALGDNPFLQGSGAQRGDRMDLARAQVLTRMIKAIPYIEDAQVLWFRAQPRGFHSPARMTAALGVRPRPGNDLTSERAQTLRQAVAACFGMQAADVTVLDLGTGHAAGDSLPGESASSAYLQAMRDFTAHYRQLITEALKDVPHVLVAVNPQIDATAASTDANQPPAAPANPGQARLTPKSVRATVSIPRDYYRDLATKMDSAPTDNSAFQARLRQIQTQKEKEIARRVSRLLPAPSGATAAECVTVGSYDRLDVEDAAAPAAATGRIGEWLTGGWGLAGMALLLSPLLFSAASRVLGSAAKRTQADSADSPPSLTLPAEPVASLPVAEDEAPRKAPIADRLRGLVRDNLQTAAAVVSQWLAPPWQGGVRKAAVVLLSLDKSLAADVMAKLSRNEAELLTTQFAQVEDVASEERDRAVEEFYHLATARGHVERGGMEYASAMLEPSLGKEKTAQVLESVRRGLSSAPFAFLQRAGAEGVLALIIDEQAQTIALILSHLPAALSAAVLARLPASQQFEVVGRIATLEPTDPEVLRDVERSIEARMQSAGSRPTEKAGGITAVAQMLTATDHRTNQAILRQLGRQNPDLVEQIRQMMFSFDDLALLDDASIRSLLGAVENSQWALALKGASQEFKSRVLGNLSQQGASMLVEEIQYLGPVRVTDIETAQRQIVEAVRRLEDAGDIVLPAGNSGSPLARAS